MLTEAEEREEALTNLCVGKCGGMDLTNHKTAYNALVNLPEPHSTNLRHMGYGRVG